ncbi:MAG: type II secretion system F family protein [Dehalococcoidales bacterium]|nr:type II secretion system F family protein [Dehalococcoidales bacterium]
MVYQYIAYNEDGAVVKGKLTASNEEAATELLSYAGYKAVSLKSYTPLLSMDKLLTSLFNIKPAEVIILYQQLAMLLESGNDIPGSLEILQSQVDNRALRKVLGEIVADLRGGGSLSSAMSRHAKVFPIMHSRLVNIGEQSGNLEIVLRQIAEDLEKEVATVKETKNALMYPSITFVVAFAVIGLLMTVVIPSFSGIYSSLGVELPPITRIMLALSNGLRDNILVILTVMAVTVLSILFYIKTKRGRYQWDRLLLRVPYLGRIRHLIELARCCRSLSLLFGAGLPLTEAMPLIQQSCGNRAIAHGLNEVHDRMVKGEGLSNPMSRNKLFLPLMVQMVRVGEETGGLDTTLLTVSRSYYTEAEFKLKSVIALIQPGMTLFIGIVVGLVALSLTSAIYGVYGTGF